MGEVVKKLSSFGINVICLFTLFDNSILSNLILLGMLAYEAQRGNVSDNNVLNLVMIIIWNLKFRTD